MYNPLLLFHDDVIYEVRFYGQVVKQTDANGRVKHRWEGGDVVEAVAHDVPIPGYRTKNTINIRLWRSVPQKVISNNAIVFGTYGM